MVKHFWSWMNGDLDDKRFDMWLGVTTGVILFLVIRSLFTQTQLLENIHTMMREQRRLTMRSIQREYEATAAAKESDTNG